MTMPAPAAHLPTLRQALTTLEQTAQLLRDRPFGGMEEITRLMTLSASDLEESLTVRQPGASGSADQESAPELDALTTQINRVRRLLAHAGHLAGEPPPDVVAREATGGTVLGIG